MSVRARSLAAIAALAVILSFFDRIVLSGQASDAIVPVAAQHYPTNIGYHAPGDGALEDQALPPCDGTVTWRSS